MKEQRKQIAQETLKIVQQGFYTAGNTHITIPHAFWRSEYHSYLITPDEGHNLVQSVSKTLRNMMTSYYPSYKVINASTVKVIIDAHKLDKPIAALNFASAKNPGGGFLNGAMAQEEALSYASNLYNTQLRHMDYYEANRACGTAIYTDHAIYSPDVIFFRDENNRLIERSIRCSVLTLPAVNMGQVRSRGECVDLAKNTTWQIGGMSCWSVRAMVTIFIMFYLQSSTNRVERTSWRLSVCSRGRIYVYTTARPILLQRNMV